MVSPGNNLSLLEEIDDISMLDGREPMCYHDRSTTYHESVECLLYESLCLRIEG